MFGKGKAGKFFGRDSAEAKFLVQGVFARAKRRERFAFGKSIVERRAKNGKVFVLGGLSLRAKPEERLLSKPRDHPGAGVRRQSACQRAARA